MTDKQRYFLAQDDSAHWYLIPVEKRDEWENWFDTEAYDLAEVPEGVQPLNMHLSCYTFTDFKVEK